MTQEKHDTSHNLQKSMLSAGIILAIFALITASLIALTYKSTEDKIAQNKKEFILKSLNQVFPKELYDNDLVGDSYLVSHPLLATEESLIYPAFKNSEPVGVILTVVAPNGYNGKIKILVGVDVNGIIKAARVVEHKETPGLGDPIEIKRSNWITQFSQRSLTNPTIDKWAVKKDSGDFDQLTGATITPRAVVKAISNALLYYQEQQDVIYTHSSEANK